MESNASHVIKAVIEEAASGADAGMTTETKAIDSDDKKS